MPPFDWALAARDAQYDRRGARLESKVIQVRMENEELKPAVGLRCPSWIESQVKSEMTRRGMSKLRLTGGGNWHLGFLLQGTATALDDELQTFLTLLSEICSLQPSFGDVDICLALDLYKVPPDDDDASSRWANTRAGDLVHRSKYWSAPDGPRAFRQLTGELSTVIAHHPRLRDADCIVSIPGSSVPVEQVAASGSSPAADLLLSDPNGSVRGIVQLTTGTHQDQLVNYTDYDAYGNPITQSGGSVETGGLTATQTSINSNYVGTTPFGFGGGYTDPTGLIYLVHRYYDPATGQFLSIDPELSVTNQPYVYAGDDPSNKSDPLGEDSGNGCIGTNSWNGFELCFAIFGTGLFVSGFLITLLDRNQIYYGELNFRANLAVTGLTHTVLFLYGAWVSSAP